MSLYVVWIHLLYYLPDPQIPWQPCYNRTYILLTGDCLFSTFPMPATRSPLFASFPHLTKSDLFLFCAIYLHWNDLCSTCAPLRIMHTRGVLPRGARVLPALERSLFHVCTLMHIQGSVVIQTIMIINDSFLFARSRRPRAKREGFNTYRNHEKREGFL